MNNIFSIEQIDTEKEQSLKIKNNGFFPDLTLNELREEMRLDGTVTTNRLTGALVEAMTFVNIQLKPFRLEQQANGYKTLQEVESEEINGETYLTFKYKRAVHHYATAYLLERYAHFDNSKTGDKKAEANQLSADNLKRDAQNAVRDLLGKQRITVALV